MKTISIRIDEDVKSRWDKLADEHGLNQSRLMREAILEKLEELEDFYIVKSRTREPFTPVANEEVWRRLGLED
jgi:RHH-type rel operon transcriptional repressor/antitoxin RelB